MQTALNQNISNYLIIVKITPTGPCEDISTRCDEFAKYCGKNSYVTNRCLKTCRVCSKFITTDFKLLTENKALRISRLLIIYLQKFQNIFFE